jgi:RNA polymerase sigma-70 factor (ECF subfamily)
MVPGVPSDPMVNASGHDVTQLLHAWASGDEAALTRLMPLVYEEIHRLARRYMAQERPDHALQTTALVNELYLRLIDVKNVDWQDRNHFYALCARLMRRVLVDFARSRNFLKRDGQFAHVPLEEAANVAIGLSADLLTLDEAMTKLAGIDQRKSDVVELRFFGGLTVEETASLLQVSPETVMRDWKLAKAWLTRELSGEQRA